MFRRIGIVEGWCVFKFVHVCVRACRTFMYNP